MSGNMLKILVATDIHLGYAEQHPVRSEDSVRTFEEILSIAASKNVDFVLLGGDLFHENRPSRPVYCKCIELLRKYCFFERRIDVEFAAQTSESLDNSQENRMNLTDPAISIGLPVLSIHGNHDDVSGSENLCALDLLHNAGLLNLFGKHKSVEEITVSPLCISKGDTRLALYGLGFVRDERLHRLFVRNKVCFADPPEGNWFKLLVLHQNRVKRGFTNYIPESYLPKSMELVIWGHEHPPQPDPEWTGDFFIIQPGSTIATSLCEGEAGAKYVCYVRIRGTEFQSEKIELKSVRPFIFRDLNASEMGLDLENPDADKTLEDICRKEVNTLLEEAKDQNPDMLPLIRLRVTCGVDVPIFNARRFGSSFMDRVANPEDLVLFKKKRDPRQIILPDMNASNQCPIEKEQEVQIQIEAVVSDYFRTATAVHQMSLLSEAELGGALRNFVLKDEGSALLANVTQQLATARTMFEERNAFTEADIHELLTKIRQRRMNQSDASHETSECNVKSEVFEDAIVEMQEEQSLDDAEERLEFDIPTSINLQRYAAGNVWPEEQSDGEHSEQDSKPILDALPRRNVRIRCTSNGHDSADDSFSSPGNDGPLSSVVLPANPEILATDSDEDLFSKASPLRPHHSSSFSEGSDSYMPPSLKGMPAKRARRARGVASARGRHGRQKRVAVAAGNTTTCTESAPQRADSVRSGRGGGRRRARGASHPIFDCI